MENKNVGWLILGISVLIIWIIFLFNNAMKKILDNTCPLTAGGYTCPAYGTINQQTYLSLAIVGILIIIGIVLIVSKPKEKIIVKKIKEKKRQIDLSNLESKEKEIIKILQQENGTIFQATLMEKTNIGKVGITRLLDKLEAKQLIERKRRGMNNIVVLR